MSKKQTTFSEFGSTDDQNGKNGSNNTRSISSDSSGSSNFDLANEQRSKSNETSETENPGSTIDNVLRHDESGSTQSTQINDPTQYDLPHSLARKWIATRHTHSWCDKTVISYQSQVRIYMLYLREKEVSLLDATFVDLLEFVEYRVMVGAAKQTVMNDCSTLKDLYRFITVRTDADPEIELYEFDELNLRKYDYEGGFEREDIDRREATRLFRSFKHARNHLMAYLAVVTSVRNSDIRALKLDDIKYNELTIHIPNPKYGNSYKVPMTRELASRLQQWTNSGRESYITTESNPYVFPAESSEKLENNASFNDVVVQAAERAGIQQTIGTATALNSRDLRDEQHRDINRVTVHTLRHTCLTMLKKAGAPPEARRKLANHKDIKTTEHYTHDDRDEYWRELIRDFLDF